MAAILGSHDLSSENIQRNQLIQISFALYVLNNFLIHVKFSKFRLKFRLAGAIQSTSS